MLCPKPKTTEVLRQMGSHQHIQLKLSDDKIQLHVKNERLHCGMNIEIMSLALKWCCHYLGT
jgi:hypothetical protein